MVCGHEVIVDIISNGSPHQKIVAATCLECVPSPDLLLGEKVERLELKGTD